MLSCSSKWAFGGAFALATSALGIFLVALAPACSSDDAAGPAADQDASTGVVNPGTCNAAGARSGGPCFPVNPAHCFVQCPGDLTGGCVCRQDPSGADAGIWVCAPADTSCLPDSAPIDEFDASDPPVPDAAVDDDDAGADDAGLDAGADADADAG